MRALFRAGNWWCNKRKSMRNKAVKIIAVFIIFFTGTCCLMAVDTICKETTGDGGKLLLLVEKRGFFH